MSAHKNEPLNVAHHVTDNNDNDLTTFYFALYLFVTSIIFIVFNSTSIKIHQFYCVFSIFFGQNDKRNYH